MIHAGRLTLLAGLTLSAAAARASKPLRDRCRRWLGSTMLLENPRIISDRVFSFVGTLVLTQADPPSDSLGGTVTLTFSQSPKPWPTLTVTLVDASVNPDGKLSFLATMAAGTALWRGSVKGTAIVNGLFGCDACYSGVWRAQRR
jgi:hypothetical protein